MKHILLVVVIVVLYMFGLSECTPATLCRTHDCEGDRCRLHYRLVVRGRYDGRAWADECSRDVVFCINGSHHTGVTLAYQNRKKFISPNAWRRSTTDREWCSGDVYWFDADA